MSHLEGAIVFLLISLVFPLEVFCLEVCKSADIFLESKSFCSLHEKPTNDVDKEVINQDVTYILYDINPVEGFNLRRDVYIRMAVFLKKLREDENYRNAKLVLPPFSDLYHWRSRQLDQSYVFWNTFFDLESMKRYTEVLDMWEFFNEIQTITRGQQKITIDEVYKLKHFQEMFENGIFEDKFEKTKCGSTDALQDNFLRYHNVTAKKVTCVNFQGSASLLKDLLDKFKPK
ncbi:hypothetical protein DMENIID0001_072090 [Sergentomyia squamirostris]